MPKRKEEYSTHSPVETMYPEGLEAVPPRFAISWRNKWMVRESDAVVGYISHAWGGAAQYVEMTQKGKKQVINFSKL